VSMGMFGVIASTALGIWLNRTRPEWLQGLIDSLH
jgi:hypothetical protein